MFMNHTIYAPMQKQCFLPEYQAATRHIHTCGVMAVLQTSYMVFFQIMNILLLLWIEWGVLFQKTLRLKNGKIICCILDNLGKHLHIIRVILFILKTANVMVALKLRVNILEIKRQIRIGIKSKHKPITRVYINGKSLMIMILRFTLAKMYTITLMSLVGRRQVCIIFVVENIKLRQEEDVQLK